jgi:hypothetical protein
MNQIPKYIAIGLAVLFVAAVGVYIDCRFAGGNVEACRVIFKQVGDRATSIIPMSK